MLVHYDEQFDVLEVFVKDPEPAVTVEIDDDLYIHVVPESRTVIGLTVHHFRERHREFAVPFGGALTPADAQASDVIVRALSSDGRGG